MEDALSFYEPTALRAPLSIISIPTDLGSDARGLVENPAYLYKHGLREMLSSIKADISQEITIDCPPAPAPSIGLLKNLQEVAAVANKAAEVTQDAARAGDLVLTLGGDHSATIGTLRGASNAHESLGVIWIDAHPDVHTPETTVTHNLHNMPAALAMGQGHELLLGERRAIQPKDFLFIALKDFSDGDKGEIEFLRRHAPPYYTMLDIAARGLSPIFASIAALAKQVEKIWIIMDMDAIDQEFAPGVAMPNTLGLTRREVLMLAQYIGKVCDIVGIDIVEMVPKNDTEGKTAGLALELIARFLGNEYSWYRGYMEHYEQALPKPTNTDVL